MLFWFYQLANVWQLQHLCKRWFPSNVSCGNAKSKMKFPFTHQLYQRANLRIMAILRIFNCTLTLKSLKRWKFLEFTETDENKLIFAKIGLTELKGQFKVQRITPWIEMWKVQAANVQWPLIVCSQRSDASNLEFQFFIKTALSLSPFLATIVHCLASYCQNELWPWL